MSMYGDGGYFFLQPVNSPKQVVSSYGDGGFYFLQQVGSPEQVVSSYGAFVPSYGEAPSVYVTSSDPACEAKLAAWKAARSNSLLKGMRASLEKELIASGCLSKSGGGSKSRPQGDTADTDKSTASLDLGEQTFLDQYGTMLLIGGGVLVAAGLGYAAWRKMK